MRAGHRCPTEKKDHYTVTMHFVFQITTIQWVLLASTLLAVALAFVLFLTRVLPLRRQTDEDNNCCADSEANFMDAAVVVYSNDDAEGLLELLPQILGQNYPGKFEVVVVNEGDSPEVTGIVAPMQTVHHNLYLTSTPDGVRNLSRKKLGVTLGIKATKMPVMVMTTSSARIESDMWLRSMMRHFSPDGPVEVVLGYAAPDPYDDRAGGSRARSFDMLVRSASWLTPAIRRHPWRGTEYNVAYTRQLFFDNKGFSKHLNLRHGDDDIFISEIANADNTVVELSDDSRVRVDGINAPLAFGDECLRRSFTGRFIKHRPRILAPVAFAMYFAALVPAAAAVALSPVNQALWVAFGVAFVLWYCAALPWRIAARCLGGRRLCLSLPLLAVTYPLRQTLRALQSVLQRGKRYTWE